MLVGEVTMLDQNDLADLLCFLLRRDYGEHLPKHTLVSICIFPYFLEVPI